MGYPSDEDFRRAHSDPWPPAETPAAAGPRKLKHGLTYREEVLRSANGCVTGQKDTVGLAGMGLAGEGGEACDLAKKFVYHGAPLNREKMIKELGDIRWYLELMCEAIGTTIEEVEDQNVAKCRERYKDGFTTAASIARVDVKEPA